jgi:hypothetical protein
MTLAQVQAAVWIVLALIGTWAGLMITVSLLLPRQSGQAAGALEISPLRCLGIGVLLIPVYAIGYVFVSIPNPAIKLIGLLILLGLGALIAIGAAGIAQLMGKRIADMGGTPTSFRMLVQGSVAFSLAMGFPFIGWLLFTPLAVIGALGAGATALLTARRTAYPPMTPPNAPDYDVVTGQRIG